MREKYGGLDQVHTANGACMNISNIGHATLHTPNRSLHLKDILHVPKAHKSRASVHRITSDNNVFLAFHPNFFLIKGRSTKTISHQGRCEGGLYPLGLKQGSTSRSKHVFGVNKPLLTVYFGTANMFITLWFGFVYGTNPPLGTLII
jgi:hypothetical protein